MQRDRVSSDTVHSVGYDPRTERLEVCLHNGQIYRLGGVPWQHYIALMTAPCMESYLREALLPAGGFRRASGVVSPPHGARAARRFWS
jgi:hypothetical protein